MTADGLATAMMVMGPEKGLAFARKRGLAVFMIVKEEDGFRAKQTAAFADYLVDENREE
jgi:thiamine biosynthesis lipoprotein